MSEKYKVQDQDCPYFLTFAVVSWVDVFTRKAYRDVVIESLRFCQKEKGLIIYAWCLMSNHIHLIVGRRGATTIDSIIRDFKKYTSVHICKAIEMNHCESRRQWMLEIFAEAAGESRKHQKYKFWENDYHPVELTSDKFVDQKLDYVHDNPVKEGIVEHPEDYLYSSARDYLGKQGLLEIDFLI